MSAGRRAGAAVLVSGLLHGLPLWAVTCGGTDTPLADRELRLLVQLQPASPSGSRAVDLPAPSAPPGPRRIVIERRRTIHLPDRPPTPRPESPRESPPIREAAPPTGDPTPPAAPAVTVVPLAPGQQPPLEPEAEPTIYLAGGLADTPDSATWTPLPAAESWLREPRELLDWWAAEINEPAWQRLVGGRPRAVWLPLRLRAADEARVPEAAAVRDNLARWLNRAGTNHGPGGTPGR